MDSLLISMANLKPFTALHYDLAIAGPLVNLISPPYDVIDPAQRLGLAARSPYNVVEIDLPTGDQPYERAADLLGQWIDQGAVVREDTPAIWALKQEYEGPDGTSRTRNGFFACVRVEPYGAGKIRPHERTHPGPKEDRLRLTRATKANLSPIFSLYADPSNRAWTALESHLDTSPWGEATDDQGTINRLWQVTDPDALASVQTALLETELLIADGHHRYETARVYADEIGGEGPHRYVLMYLVALEDPGLTVFPTHRLVKGLSKAQREALREAMAESFDLVTLDTVEELAPDSSTPLKIGYLDSYHRQPYMLTLKDQAIVDAALPDKPEPYRRLDTAVLEALLLKKALGMSDDDISHVRGLGYARSFDEARALIEDGTYEAGFFMAPIPIEQIGKVAEAGETMPQKSTFFYPKVPTGLLFNALN
ncbi:MAG: DUF1015 domain-containing protein [Actinomycetota bacterium]